MDNFNTLVSGGHQDEDMVGDGWTEIFRTLAGVMPKPDSPARTAIISIKTGKTSWTKANWRKEKRASAVLPVIDRIRESTWNRLFTISASVVIGRLQKKIRRQVPVIAGDVI
jgi:hypothetical protein